MRGNIVFRAFAGLLIVAGLVHVGTLWPRVASLIQNVPVAAIWIVGGFAVSAATAVLACLLAGFLLWKAWDRPAARSLILFLAFLSIFWGSLFRFLEMTSDGDSISVNLSYGSGWDSQFALASFLLAVASFVRFTALFPRPLAESRPGRSRVRWLRWLREATWRPGPVWGGAIVLFGLIRIVPEIVTRVVGPPPFDQADMLVLVWTNLALMAVGYLVIPALAVVVGVLNLRSSYRRADPQERRRMTWVRVGFSAATWMILAAIGTGIVAGTFAVPERLSIAIPVLFGLAPLAVVIGSAIAVLYSGAIDPGLALQRSTVWGILAALAVIAFAAIENGLSALVEDRLGLPGFAGSMVAGGIVAALLIPVRRPLQGFVKARFGGADPPREVPEPG